VLKGAGIEFNRIAGPGAKPGVYNGVVIARINTDVTLADFEAQVRDLVYDVEETYWDLYLAYRDLDAKMAGRAAALQTWRSVQRKFQVGTADREQEAQAREQYYFFDAQVINAISGISAGALSRSLPVPGGVYTTERRLRRLLGMPASDGPIIRPFEEPSTTLVVFDWDASLEESLTRRVELRKQKWIVKRRELELIAARNFLKMRADVIGRYGFRGFGNDLLGPRNVEAGILSQEVPYGSAFGDLFSGEKQEWYLGFELSTPIGNRIGHVAVRNAELLLARERAIHRDQEFEIMHELSDAFAELDRAHTAARANFNGRLAAHQQLQAITRKYDAGRVPLEFLLDAQRRTTDRDSVYYRTLVDYSLAIANVNFARGSYLNEHAIFLSEGPWSCRAHLSAAKQARRFRPKLVNYCFVEPCPVSRGAYPQMIAHRDQPESVASPAPEPQSVEPRPDVPSPQDFEPEETFQPLPQYQLPRSFQPPQPIRAPQEETFPGASVTPMDESGPPMGQAEPPAAGRHFHRPLHDPLGSQGQMPSLSTGLFDGPAVDRNSYWPLQESLISQSQTPTLNQTFTQSQVPVQPAGMIGPSIAGGNSYRPLTEPIAAKYEAANPMPAPVQPASMVGPPVVGPNTYRQSQKPLATQGQTPAQKRVPAPSPAIAPPAKKVGPPLVGRTSYWPLPEPVAAESRSPAQDQGPAEPRASSPTPASTEPVNKVGPSIAGRTSYWPLPEPGGRKQHESTQSQVPSPILAPAQKPVSVQRPATATPAIKVGPSVIGRASYWPLPEPVAAESRSPARDQGPAEPRAFSPILASAEPAKKVGRPIVGPTSYWPLPEPGGSKQEASTPSQAPTQPVANVKPPVAGGHSHWPLQEPVTGSQNQASPAPNPSTDPATSRLRSWLRW
jgi:outer membrane protein TolC